MGIEEKVSNIHNLVNEIIDSKEERFIPGKTLITTGMAVYSNKEINAIIDSLLDGWLGLSKRGKEFETLLSEYIGNKGSVFVNSGSSANLLALNAIKNKLNLKNGEIITPACTFPTTLNPIIQLGFEPCFVDIDKTINIDPENVRLAVNERTRGIIVPHTLGNPSKIDDIMGIAKERDLFVIEDCCDAIGSSFDGKKCGSFGDASTFSFYPAHGITTGEGGAISTNDCELDKIIRSLRDWGKDCWCRSDDMNLNGACNKRFDYKINGSLYDHRYIYSQIGYNMKPLELQAAMGVEQIKKLEEFNNIRKRNFKLYKEGLSSLERYLELPESYSNADPIFFGLPLIIKDESVERKDMLKFLNDNKIATRLLFAGNIILQPAYRNTKYSKWGNLDHTNKIMEKCFWVGLHPKLNEEMIEYVLSKFREYFKIK